MIPKLIVSAAAQSSHVGDHIATYVELDFPENTFRKAKIIRKSELLSAALGEAPEIQIGAASRQLSDILLIQLLVYFS